MFVVFSNGEELIVTTLELEPRTLETYFVKGGRDLLDYDRHVPNDNDGVSICAYLRVN